MSRFTIEHAEPEAPETPDIAEPKESLRSSCFFSAAGFSFDLGRRLKSNRSQLAAGEGASLMDIGEGAQKGSFSESQSAE